LETRAKFILIGAFTIAGFLGILAFFLMFARIELDRQFDYYDIRFSSVSGLGNASDVRFSGLPVGQVVDVRLSPDEDGSILVRIEVDGDTPVRTDSIATIEAQGVTGVSFVNIGPGTSSAPLLVGTDAEPIPEIEAGRSTLQSLSEDAPALVNETLEAVRQVRDLLGGENEGRLQRILVNVESASEDFAKTLEDFSSVAKTVTSFAEQIGRFNTTLETLTDDLANILETADQTLISIGELSEEARTVVARGSEALDSVQGTLAQTESYIADELTATTKDVRQTVVDLREQVAVISQDAQTLMETLGTTGSTATARLEEARTTLEAVNGVVARLDETAASVGDAAERLGGLIDQDASPLLTETRALVANAQKAVTSVNAVVDTDLPTIIADIRTATETSSKVITDVGENLTSASGRIDEIAEQAGVALADASGQHLDGGGEVLARDGPPHQGGGLEALGLVRILRLPAAAEVG
jgi:phospholipid/cholesterol/gamma-HCH transport system substrate-binding protein